MAVRVGPSKRMKRNVLRPLKGKDWEGSYVFLDNKENKWVGSKHSWNNTGIVRLCEGKEASILWSHHEKNKRIACRKRLCKEQCTVDVYRRGRPRTAWISNISMWSKLTAEGSIRMRNDRDQWRKYVHGLANARIEYGWWTELNWYVNK